MEESAEVRDAMIHFFERLSASDVESFYRLVELGPATLVIGSAPGEWVTEEERLRFGFEAEGVRVEPSNPKGYAEGSLGWVVDEPVFYFPDGSRISTRLTMIFHHADGAWKLVHMHVSVGVPDEEVLALQQKWGTAPSTA